MLKVENINTYYGLSHILFDVSLSLTKGEIVGLLGRNGAGKSTTMRSIVSFTPPRQGSIMFNGRPIAGRSPFLLVREGRRRKGSGRTFSMCLESNRSYIGPGTATS